MMDSEVFRKILPAEFHRRFLVENRRADGRAFHSYRHPTVATNVLSNCCGSASVRCGNSYYLAGVRCEVGRPVEVQGVDLRSNESQFPTLNTEPGSRVPDTDDTKTSTNFVTTGHVSVSVEFPKLCGAEFRDSGGPCTQIPLLVSEVVADLVNSPEVIDKRQFVFSYNTTPSTSTSTTRSTNSNSVKCDSFPENAAGITTSGGGGAGAGSCPESEVTSSNSARECTSSHAGCALDQYAWHLFIHVLCLEYDGNPLDFAALAAVAALEDTWLPGVSWDESAKWWRQLPPPAEQENERTSVMEIAGNSSENSKPEGSNITEATLCFIPTRKVRLLERPVAVTFSHLLSAFWVVDPTKEEEALGCWLTICLIKDRWEVTRFGGPPVKFEVLGTLKSVAGVIAKGIKRLVKVPNGSA